MSTCPDCETGRNLLAGACRSVFQRGLTGGSAGNMSLRVEGGILATPTGIPFGELTPGNLSLLDETGALVSGPKATKEAPFHLAWYKANPDHLAVVHLHSPWAVAVSCLADLDPGSPLPPLTPYQLMKLGHLAVAPYAKPGSAELCAGVARLARTHGPADGQPRLHHRRRKPDQGAGRSGGAGSHLPPLPDAAGPARARPDS